MVDPAKDKSHTPTHNDNFKSESSNVEGEIQPLCN